MVLDNQGLVWSKLPLAYPRYGISSECEMSVPGNCRANPEKKIPKIGLQLRRKSEVRECKEKTGGMGNVCRLVADLGKQLGAVRQLRQARQAPFIDRSEMKWLGLYIGDPKTVAVQQARIRNGGQK